MNPKTLRIRKEVLKMWYYTIHGNESQLLKSSKDDSLFFRTEQEAITAGGEVAVTLARIVGAVLSVQVGQMGISNSRG
jgi:hypothetical protein